MPARVKDWEGNLLKENKKDSDQCSWNKDSYKKNIGMSREDIRVFYGDLMAPHTKCIHFAGRRYKLWIVLWNFQ